MHCLAEAVPLLMSEVSCDAKVASVTFAGFGMMQQMAASNTILQTITDNEKRGRVMSYYSMAFMGMAPFGSLTAGYLASQIGVAQTLTIGGAICIAASLWFAQRLPRIRDLVRPIYVHLGILPQLVIGINEASSLQSPPET